jgi:mRNA-degrading endonuclease RelE of RelBE toxin-antitoxin system
VSYQLSIPRSINKRVEKLPTEAYEWVDSAILALAEEPLPPDGEQRVVEILNVTHHREIYRR